MCTELSTPQQTARISAAFAILYCWTKRWHTQVGRSLGGRHMHVHFIRINHYELGVRGSKKSCEVDVRRTPANIPINTPGCCSWVRYVGDLGRNRLRVVVVALIASVDSIRSTRCMLADVHCRSLAESSEYCGQTDISVGQNFWYLRFEMSHLSSVTHGSSWRVFTLVFAFFWYTFVLQKSFYCHAWMI
jgi:hypothetical protein